MLTDTATRNAKFSGKPLKLADRNGMFLLVNQAGKYWRWNYRFAGKRKTLALGVYPTVTLAAARDALDKARARLAAGEDPGAVKQAEKVARKVAHANSFEAVGREWHAQKSKAWAKVTADKALTHLETYLFPKFGSRPVSEIRAPELLDALREVEKRGAVYTATRLREIRRQERPCWDLGQATDLLRRFRAEMLQQRAVERRFDGQRFELAAALFLRVTDYFGTLSRVATYDSETSLSVIARPLGEAAVDLMLVAKSESATNQLLRDSSQKAVRLCEEINSSFGDREREVFSAHAKDEKAKVVALQSLPGVSSKESKPAEKFKAVGLAAAYVDYCIQSGAIHSSHVELLARLRAETLSASERRAAKSHATNVHLSFGLVFASEALLHVPDFADVPQERVDAIVKRAGIAWEAGGGLPVLRSNMRP